MKHWCWPQKEAATFSRCRSTWPRSDPDEAVNESGGRWLKHHLSPMNGKSEKSDRRDIKGLTKMRFHLTGEGMCRRDYMHSLTEKMQCHGSSSMPLLLFTKFLSICREFCYFCKGLWLSRAPICNFVLPELFYGYVIDLRLSC
jgi:hypothetical protein